jgi:hypothetical protein
VLSCDGNEDGRKVGILAIDNISRHVMENISLGIVPVNTFRLNCKFNNFVQFTNSAGIKPDKLLSTRFISIRAVSNPISEGIEPVK